MMKRALFPLLLLVSTGALAASARVLPSMPASVRLTLHPAGTCLVYPAPIESYDLKGRGIGVSAPSPKTLCLAPSPAWPDRRGELTVRVEGRSQRVELAGTDPKAPSTWVFQSIPPTSRQGRVKPVPSLKPTRGDASAGSTPPGLLRFRVYPVWQDGVLYLTYELQATGLPGPTTLRPDDLALELCGRPFAGYDLYRRSDDATPSQIEPGEMQVGVLELKPPKGCRTGRLSWQLVTLAHPQRTYYVQARFAWPAGGGR